MAGQIGSNMTGSANSRRIASLDGLRAVAIGCVLVAHLGFTKLPYLGAFGVRVFFVISGYLITRLLLEERQRNGKISLQAFYIRRCFRIFPAAFAVIAITALLSPQARPELPWALTYTMSYHFNRSTELFGHLWSLSVEEQFYLLWPLALCFGFAQRARVAWVAFGFAALSRFACVELLPARAPWLVHYCFPCVIDEIAAGCLLAIYEPRLKAWRPRRLTAVTLSLVTYASAVLLWHRSFPSENQPHLVLLWGIIPILVAACLFIAVQQRPWFLNNAVAYALGGLSYSIYLWQQPLTIDHRAPLLIVLFLLMTLASVSYFVIEQPLIALGKAISAGRLSGFRGFAGPLPSTVGTVGHDRLVGPGAQ
jgi:peptidoglycan/LPS O-acetylase OafA/YrhL